MAWRCSGNTNAELIANLVDKGLIKLDRVAAAMKKVDRANYTLVPARRAYEDSPQTIGYDATISAPHMHALAAEHLTAKSPGDTGVSPFLFPGAKVLDVGSGSGYFVAMMYHLVTSGEKKGKVVGIDHIPELVEFSVYNLNKDGLGLALKDGSIEMVVGDGRQGYASGGPYSAIHVGAAAPTIPSALLEQLACPGRMFIPVGTKMSGQRVIQVDKDANGNVTRKDLMGVSYVPLTDRV